MKFAAIIFLALAIPRAALAAQVIVNLPDNITAVSTQALAPSPKPGQDGPATPGVVTDHGAVEFDQLDGATPYDLEITLKDGRILRGVNLNSYDLEPDKPDAGDLTADDHDQIRQLVSDVLSFYNISRILALKGNHNRAVAVVERTRTKAFHSDKGGEAIYRVEIWYFLNEFGGWQEVPQENKVLIRKRLASDADYHASADPMRWLGDLGGVVVGKSAPVTISISAAQIDAAAPTTAPADADGN
jgi:hypothetical protein